MILACHSKIQRLDYSENIEDIYLMPCRPQNGPVLDTAQHGGKYMQKIAFRSKEIKKG